MPEINVGAQIFDLAFHPSEPLVFVGLLNGKVKAYRYDEQGDHEERFDLRPSKRSCRGLTTNADGSRLYAVGKGKAMHTIDVASGKICDSKLAIHDAPINRIKRLMPNMLCTGDDDGVVKVWDTRQQDAIRTYNQHFDFVSDFMWIENKRHLVITSGDGTLSVVDVRSSKPEPVAQSEDQEDELLSIVPIKGGEKSVVGTQLGVLSIFNNRQSGWGDCVDRVPGHPHSIDALCSLPSSYPSSHSTILTGSSDGLLRAVQLLPTKLIGVIADHGDFPIERIAVDMSGEGRWVGSVGHDEILRLTDLIAVFEDEADGDDAKEPDERQDSDSDDDGDDVDAASTTQKSVAKEEEISEQDSGGDAGADSDDSDEPKQQKRKRKQEKDPLAKERKKKKKGRDEVSADPSFFADL